MTIAAKLYAGAGFYLRGGGDFHPDDSGFRPRCQAWVDEVRSEYTVKNLQLFDFVPGGEETNLIATVDGKNVYHQWKRWEILDRPSPGPILECPWIKARGASWTNFYGLLFEGPATRYKGMKIS